LRLHEGVDGQGIGIAEIDVRPYEFSRTLDAFFQSIAANEPRGLFPRYLCGEQTYWTSVGSARGGVTQALLNEEGMLEVDRGAFSIEPFLYVDDKLVTWADGSPTQDLEQGFLPIPSSVWRKDGIVLGTTAFDQGAVTEYLLSGDVPPDAAVSDRFGYASGALRYDLDLTPSSARDVYLVCPFGAADPAVVTAARGSDGGAQLDVAIREWSAKLGHVGVRLPEAARAFRDTFRTAAAHILVNRDGAAFQPGPRRYARSWIRDGATMAAALLRVGCVAEVRDYIRWYVPHQAPDGTVPCCVDRNGADWLAEYDSQGELIYAVMEYFRFTRDRAFLTDMW